jgi:hypothetical protein
MKTMTLKANKLEEELKTSLNDNKLLKSDVADLLKKQEKNNNENECNLQSEVQELKNKLKVNKKHIMNLKNNVAAMQ